MSKKPETKFKEKVHAKLKTLKHCWYYKTQEVSRRGIPDIIMCYRGKFIAIELKVDAPIESLQEYTIKKIRSAYGLAFVITPDSWDEFWQFLLGFKG